MVILFLPALLMILWRSYHARYSRDSMLSLLRKHWHWALGPLCLGVSYMVLNYLRFGSILEFGHSYLPEFQRAEFGQFSLNYLADNLRSLLRLPGFDPETLRISFQPFEAWCFVLIDPFSVLCVAISLTHICKPRGKKDRPIVTWIWFACLIYVVILCCHRTLGGWQFGNRVHDVFL